jgi:hypothetical protein
MATTTETARAIPPIGANEDFILRLAARWEVAHAQAHLEWAKSDQRHLYGRGDSSVYADVTCYLEEMRVTEAALADLTPPTVAAALAMISVASTILAAREKDPESTIGSGPALEIMRGVRRGLECSDPHLSLTGEI